jgi:DNA-binding transcriptional LysR family regulator
MLSLRRLRLLRELEARGTVGAVAATLDYTPSAVSQQLRVLEQEVGAPLVERAGRGVRLTDAGRLLADHAGRLLEAAEAAEAALAGAGSDGIRATVRVAAFQSALLELVAPALERLAGEAPGIRLEVVEREVEEALPDLRLQHLDLVIGDEYEGVPRPRHPDLARETLLREEVRVVLPRAHPLARRRRVPLAELAGAAWASTVPGTGHRAMHVGACRALGGFEPDIRHASNDLMSIQRLVETGQACALLPDLVYTARPSRTVAWRPIAEGHVWRDVFVVTRRTRAPAVETALAALRVAAAQVTGGDP